MVNFRSELTYEVTYMPTLVSPVDTWPKHQVFTFNLRCVRIFQNLTPFF